MFHWPQVLCEPGFLIYKNITNKILMNRVIFFVDGFNLYHALDYYKQYHKYKWLNLSKLANCFITKNTKIENKYDNAIIISGDSDLIPSIKAVKNIFPLKKIVIIIPIGRRSEELKQICDFHMKMKEKHLKTCLFDREINLGNNKKLICPSEWI